MKEPQICVKSTDLKNKLGRSLRGVIKKGQTVGISRHGTISAVLVSKTVWNDLIDPKPINISNIESLIGSLKRTEKNLLASIRAGKHLMNSISRELDIASVVYQQVSATIEEGEAMLNEMKKITR